MGLSVLLVIVKRRLRCLKIERRKGPNLPITNLIVEDLTQVEEEITQLKGGSEYPGVRIVMTVRIVITVSFTIKVIIENLTL